MTAPHRTLQQALDALDAITDDVDGTGLNTMPSFDKAIDAIAALREALNAPEPEPVAWYLPSPDGDDSIFRDHRTVVACTGNKWEGFLPLYAAPPAAPAVPLTDEQVAAGIEAWFTTEIAGKNQPFEGRMRAAYAAINGITGGKP